MGRPRLRRVSKQETELMALMMQGKSDCICLLDGMCMCIEKSHAGRLKSEVIESNVINTLKSKIESDRAKLEELKIQTS
jgi:hypothetical protein